MSNRHSGFTLIELLVVIAIITILAAILFPVFSKAREKGRQVACINNQHQVSLAITVYCQDNGEALPTIDNVWTATKLSRLPAAPVIASAQGSAQVLVCPNKATLPNGYVYDSLIAGLSLGDSSIGDPTTTFLTADGQHFAPYANIAFSQADLDTHRHGGGKNIIASFLDGHVAVLNGLIFPTAPWPTFHGDNLHTGRSLHTGPATAAVMWTYATGNYVKSSPAIGLDGTVYVGSDDGSLYAISGGSVKWAYPTAGTVDSSPAIGPDGTIYVGSADNYLYALNPDGTFKWKFIPPGGVNTPTVGADGTIYVGADHGECMYALRPDGGQKWAYQTGNYMVSAPAIGTDGTVYVCSEDNNLYAFKPDGTLKWAYPTNLMVGGSASIGADGTVYLADYNGTLHALDPATGTENWHVSPGGLIMYSTPAIAADGTLYIGSWDKNLYAVNPTTHAVIWHFTTGAMILSSPVIGADGTIYIGSEDHNVYAINPNGSQKWVCPTGSAVTSSPAIGADGTIYIGSCDNKLYAIGPGRP